MRMWHGTLWILKCEAFNTDKLQSTGKVINELLSSLFQGSRKNPKTLLNDQAFTFVCLHLWTGMPDSIAEGIQPTRWLSCYSACSQSSLPWLSLPLPPRNAVPTCCWKGKTSAAFSPLFKQAPLGRGNTLAAQYSMKNYFNYFRGSKHPLWSLFFLPPNH